MKNDEENKVKQNNNLSTPKFTNGNIAYDLHNESDFLSPKSEISILPQMTAQKENENNKSEIEILFDFKDDCNVMIKNNKSKIRPNISLYKNSFENILRDTEVYLKNKYKNDKPKWNIIPYKVHKLQVKMLLKLIFETFFDDKELIKENIFGRDLKDKEIKPKVCFVLTLAIPKLEEEYIMSLFKEELEIQDNLGEEEKLLLHRDIGGGLKYLFFSENEEIEQQDYPNLLLEILIDICYSNPKLYRVFKEVIDVVFSSSNLKSEYMTFIKTLCIFLYFAKELNSSIKILNKSLQIQFFCDDESYMKEAKEKGYLFEMSDEGRKKAFLVAYKPKRQDRSNANNADENMNNSNLNISSNSYLNINNFLDENNSAKVKMYTKSIWIPYTKNSSQFFKLYSKSEDTLVKKQSFENTEISILKNLDRLRLLYSKIDNCLNFKNFQNNQIFLHFKMKRELNDDSPNFFSVMNIFTESGNKNLCKTFQHNFGQNVAFYFGWTAHLLKWIIYLCLLILPLLYFNKSNVSDKLTLNGVPIAKTMDYVFTVIFLIWFKLYLQSWKGLETVLSIKWGSYDTPNVFEKDREDFYSNQNIQIFSCHIPYGGGFKKFLAYFTSFFITLVMIVFTVASLIYLQEIQLPEIKKKNELDKLFSSIKKRDKIDTLYYTFIPYLIGFYIKLLAKIYDHICKRLTENENHQKETSHRNSFLLKSIIFNLVNHYITFYYIVFVKSTNSTCPMDCYEYLITQLEKIFYSYFTATLFEMFTPIVNITWINFHIKRKIQQAHPNCDTQKLQELQENLFNNYKTDLLPDYDLNSLTKEYMDIIILFGYISQFSLNNPILILSFFVYVTLQRYVDSIKFYKYNNISIFSTAKNIGVFNKILQLLLLLSSFVTLYITFFIKNIDERHKNKTEHWFAFVITQNVIFVLIFFLDFDFLPAWFDYYNQIRSDFIKMKETYIRDREVSQKINPQLFNQLTINTNNSSLLL